MLWLEKERVELASEKEPDTAEACAAVLIRAYDNRMRAIELCLQSPQQVEEVFREVNRMVPS